MYSHLPMYFICVVKMKCTYSIFFVKSINVFLHVQPNDQPLQNTLYKIGIWMVCLQYVFSYVLSIRQLLKNSKYTTYIWRVVHQYEILYGLSSENFWCNFSNSLENERNFLNESGNLTFGIHSVENSRFFCHSDFTWNQFGEIRSF